MVLSGIMSVLAAGFLYLYEGEWGAEYYLEEYESGLFSNFTGMLLLCVVLGAILIIAGIILHNRGKKTEGEQLKKLEAIRRDKLDALLHEIHGAVPGKAIEPKG